ncbi:MAG: hypothetical protein HON90_11510 [Halobacteriovoraceae bacterium]|nr:hypothetical protein [Halobacteriovoraceae bacterium]
MPQLNWINTNANYTIQVSENILVDASAGSFTLTLPDTPSHGDMIRIVHGKGDLTTNTVIILPGLQDTLLRGVGLDFDLNNSSVTLLFFDHDEGAGNNFNDGNGDWRVF